MSSVSIILPAKNEADGLAELLPKIKKLHPEAELIVVNDSSTDDTLAICQNNKVKVINHPYTMGNGSAIKSGARAATGEILVFMDADGQHDPNNIQILLDELTKGYDMVVGARQYGLSQAPARRIANKVYNTLASLMTGFRILDLTSGFRAARAEKFKRFLYLLPNGFSYPTTITMAFLRSAFPISYIPIEARRRMSSSKIRLFRDGLRFFIIILRVGALFSPMRLFLPISAALFLVGALYYSYTYIMFSRFTNMSALLFISALFTFLIGILSEQISSLHYRNSESMEWLLNKSDRKD